MSDKLRTEPYKGVRDFYPEDARTLNYLFEGMRRVLASYGYEEYNASPLEPAELYEGKTNEEIVRDQTYTFVDRGDRRVTLRPEMTPTVARMVAGRRRELTFPLRWFSIPNVFRYERPQRGRLREHYQLNFDIFGVETMDAEIETIEIATELLRTFGAKHSDFEIRLNSRSLINAAFHEAGFSKEQAKDYLRLIDRTEKISKEEFESEKKELMGEKHDPEALMEHPSPGSPTEKAKKELFGLIDTLKTRGIPNVRYDKTLARGFDYYTSIVFEVFDLHPDNRRSLFGGGRYDNLASLFSDENIPAVGCAVGDVTLRDFLDTHRLLKELGSDTDLYIGIIDEMFRGYVETLARAIRQSGVHVAVHFGEKKVGDQVKIASKKNIPFFVAIGENETKSKTLKVKNLTTGAEKELGENDIASYILNSRKS